MEKAKLFEHNEQAYKKLLESLKNNKCTTINHATGTGKSFIALKYLYENRDKKYLYLAPTYPIIEQLLADCYKIGLTPEDINIDTIIYRTLLKMDMDELYKKYDGIVFDEYHRTGARETYKKIKQLKLNLQESDDSKKFIGLTATPVRYLDDERNMTQEIFDGNVASSISLSEAMLDGLLPVPLYINSKIACRDELNKISRRVARLAPSKEKQGLEEKLEQISQKINNGTQDIKQMISQYITERNGKYIIFCNTISELEDIYQNVDDCFSELGKINKYKVYSNQVDEENLRKGLRQRNNKELNQANLDAFNKEENGISVLLCVDILNEGVHVDNIDGVILLRKTISPIIYFQQIGRALSFSGRNKQIKIFDLVNNFGSHNAIDSIYTEFQEEMRKKIKLHPEKAKQYQGILDRFRIMDETKDILKELNEIDEQVTPEKIITSKIDYSLKLLNYKNSNELINIFDDEDIQKAYSTIAKYYRYIDNEQFKELLNLSIMLPEELSMSYEERLEQLEGCNSINEHEQVGYDLCIDSFIKFVTETGKRPESESNDINEKKLYQRYLNCISNLNEKQKTKLRNFMDDNSLEYNSWEKILLGKKVYGKDIEDIIEISRMYLKDNQILPEYIQRAITNIVLNYNIRQNEELFSILEQSEEIEQKYRKQREQERLQKLTKIVDALEANASLNEQELKEIGIVDEIIKLKPADRYYIKRKYSSIKRKQYQEIISGTDKSDLMTFCKKMRMIETDEFDIYFSSIKKDQEMYVTLNGIIEFMTKNGGKLPNKKSKNELEKKLAKQLEIYVENGIVLPNIINLETDMQSQWFSPEKIMYRIILEGFKETNIKLAILRNIEFFNKHGNSQDEDERMIATEYEKKCIDNMDQDKIAILNRIFNGKKNIYNTCEAYINNILASQEERH